MWRELPLFGSRISASVPHDLIIQKAGVGLYRSSLNVTEVPAFTVEATLRPTLLWVGLTRDQEVTSRQQEAASEAMAGSLGGMVHFNAVIADEKNPVLPDTFFTPVWEPRTRRPRSRSSASVTAPRDFWRASSPPNPEK